MTRAELRAAVFSEDSGDSVQDHPIVGIGSSPESESEGGEASSYDYPGYPGGWQSPYDEGYWDEVQQEMAQERAVEEAEAWELALEEQNRHNDLFYEQEDVILRELQDEENERNQVVLDARRREEVEGSIERLRLCLGPSRPSPEQIELWRRRREQNEEADRRFMELVEERNSRVEAGTGFRRFFQPPVRDEDHD